MRQLNCFLFLLLFLCCDKYGFSQDMAAVKYDAVYSGVPWMDDRGNVINAHGGSIIQEKGKFYFFGECHSDTSNAFNGFNCYSSTDLYNWKFERQVLKLQLDGLMGPKRVGERVKVMKCPLTGEFVLFMHTDNMEYKDPVIGFATCATVKGDYSFKGALLFDSKPIKKWDMGVFQDSDGSGYLLIHGGNIFKLANDYHSITEQVLKEMAPKSESPVIFKANNTYFWIGSSLTSWERNDNFYYTSNDLKGPWISKGHFAPDKTLTWNSQATFVLAILGAKDTMYLFMGDRWSYPKQASAATYVWQPLTIFGTSLAIPNFIEALQIDLNTGKWTRTEKGTESHPTKKQFSYQGKWEGSSKKDTVAVLNSSASAGATMNIGFTGTQIKLYGYYGPNGGYARIKLMDRNRKVISTSITDFYSKYRGCSLNYVSPQLLKGVYNLSVEVLVSHSQWSNKAHAMFGSTGDEIAVAKVIVQ
jgi:hypothetical protein